MDERREIGEPASHETSGNAGAAQVRVHPAPPSLKPALRRLLTDYLDEAAASEGVAPRLRDEDGQAVYRWFDHYWTEAGRTPLAIWVGDDLAGFCFLRNTDEQWRIAEFYVAPPYRRQRVGASAVTAVKRYCRASGNHTLLEASTLVWNTAALSFWRSQGFRTVSVTPERLINVFQWQRRYE
jgi:predicted acetyltransferase